MLNTFGVSPEQFIRTVATLYPKGHLANGLPPSTDEILQTLEKKSQEGSLTNEQRSLYTDLSHLTFGSDFRHSLTQRILNGRSWAVNVCCPTMPRDSLGENTTLPAIGGKVAYAAKKLFDEYHQIPNFPNVPDAEKRVAVLMSIFATPNYPGKDFDVYATDQRSLDLERTRLSAYTHPDLRGNQIGKLEFVYPNHVGFFNLWDKLELPELKKSGKGTAMFVASLAVLARQFEAQIPDRNGFYFAMDTDLKVPSSAYLAGFMNSALHDSVASIASFFRINAQGVETGRLNAIMTPFMEAFERVLGQNTKHRPGLREVMGVIRQINYQLSGERQFRTDLLKDIPIGGGYFYETSINLDLASKVIDPNYPLRESDIANVQIGTYAHHNQPANRDELVAQNNASSGRTLEHMASEILQGFFRAIVAEMKFRIYPEEIAQVSDLTYKYGAMMIGQKSELAQDVGLNSPNEKALKSLLTHFCGAIITEFNNVNTAYAAGQITDSPRLTLQDVLLRAGSRQLFGEVNTILKDSSDGIKPSDLRRFE